MAKPPAGYSLQRGAYFTADGQGPYSWNGVSMQLIGATAAGGSGGWGSDRTAGTFALDAASGEYVVATETIDGIPWTVGRDLLGREVLRQWGSGGLSRAIDYSLGGGVASGNVIVHGNEVWVPSSAMATLKTQLTALGSAAAGAPRFYVYDYFGSRGLVVEWNYIDACFRPICSGMAMVYSNLTPVVGVNPGSAESAALFTFAFPAWLRGPQGQWKIKTFSGYSGVTSGSETKKPEVKLNGTTLGNITSNANSLTVKMAIDLDATSATAFLSAPATSGIGADAFGQSSGAPNAAWSIPAGTDLTFTMTETIQTGASVTRTSYYMRVFYSHP